MTTDLAAIGIELVVEDLDRAIELFGGVLGCPVSAPSESTIVVGRMAVVDAGGIAITLLEPADSGPGTLLSDRTPRLSQIVFGAAGSADVRSAHDTAIESGLAVVPFGNGFHLSPESLKGALGQLVAVVVTEVAGG